MAKRISPERELLKRWFKEFGSICCNKNLILETKELLAQPEQEQPFCWCIESKNSADWCFSADKSGVIENAKFLGEPSLSPFPLYLSPRNQIPMNFDEISDIWKMLEANTFDEAIMSYARAIEKAHGIGVENDEN